jgi:hypothetical protein
MADALVDAAASRRARGIDRENFDLSTVFCGGAGFLTDCIPESGMLPAGEDS